MANMKWIILWIALFPSEREMQDSIQPIQTRTISNPVIKNLKRQQLIRGNNNWLNIFQPTLLPSCKASVVILSTLTLSRPFSKQFCVSLHDNEKQQDWIQQPHVHVHVQHLFCDSMSNSSMVATKSLYTFLSSLGITQINSLFKSLFRFFCILWIYFVRAIAISNSFSLWCFNSSVCWSIHYIRDHSYIHSVTDNITIYNYLWITLHL